MHDIKHTLKVLPIHVINPRSDMEDSLLVGEELESLIDTFGGVIVDRVIQRLDRPNNNTYIGRGKVIEVEKKLSDHDKQIAKRILIEIHHRLNTLLSVGLGYLTLNRLANSLRTVVEVQQQKLPPLITVSDFNQEILNSGR